MKAFSITNTTRGTLPRVVFSRIKERILGKHYELSVVFVGEERMRRLNREHRGIDTATDILSFPLSKHSGEIFIHLASAKKKASVFSLKTTHYVAFIFIHGCLHLKGYAHGRTMETLEDSWCRSFDIPPPAR